MPRMTLRIVPFLSSRCSVVSMAERLPKDEKSITENVQPLPMPYILCITLVVVLFATFVPPDM